MRRVGIDVGGTFTDVVLLDSQSGQVWSAKVPTTPKDPTQGALNGLRTILQRSDSKADSFDFIGHGTTIATNMVIEAQGCLDRHWDHDVRLPRYSRTAPRLAAMIAPICTICFSKRRGQLVSRRHRLEITERVAYDGSIEQTVDPGEIGERLAELKAAGVEAIAVCLINSPVNSGNEREVLKIIRERVNDVFVSGSIEVNPEIMEYERTCTTVMNALLGPNCGRYAQRFTENARNIGLASDVYFMQSNGGLASPEVVSELPVTLLASGPAGA